MNTEENLKSLINKRDKVTTGFFWLGLKLAVIFGVPAVIAAYFGKKLDVSVGHGWLFRIVFLASAFVLSWVIVYFEYKKLSRKLKAVDSEIKSLQKELEQKND